MRAQSTLAPLTLTRLAVGFGEEGPLLQKQMHPISGSPAAAPGGIKQSLYNFNIVVRHFGVNVRIAQNRLFFTTKPQNRTKIEQSI
jgi:hypothetical protein